MINREHVVKLKLSWLFANLLILPVYKLQYICIKLKLDKSVVMHTLSVFQYQIDPKNISSSVLLSFLVCLYE